MLDGFFDLPVPQEDVEWELNNVHVYGQLLAGVFKHPDSHGITITRWKDRVNWVVSFAPR